MGQQQLLLLVVGIILVAVTITIGITQFGNSTEDGVKDSVVLQLNYLGNKAIQHYMKPGALAGGGNTFDGSGPGGGVVWSIPISMVTSPDAGFGALITAQSVTITGTPVNYLWTAIATVTPTGVTVAGTW